jgi:predicted transcriptional regulator
VYNNLQEQYDEIKKDFKELKTITETQENELKSLRKRARELEDIRDQYAKLSYKYDDLITGIYEIIDDLRQYNSTELDSLASSLANKIRVVYPVERHIGDNKYD